jgi:hypothetical protein
MGVERAPRAKVSSVGGAISTNLRRLWSGVGRATRRRAHPVGASSAKVRFFHLATVFELIPYCSAGTYRLC